MSFHKAVEALRTAKIQTLHVIVPIASLVTFVLGTALVALLRTISGVSQFEEKPDPADLSLRDYSHLKRLLDPADFDYLRQRGMSEERINKLRSERRKIFRLCLRGLAQDFNRIHGAVHLIMVQSKIDRPDLAAELASQRMTFYRNLLRVEVRLTLHAFGFDSMPAVNLLQPLEVLQAQLNQLATSSAAA